MVAWQRVQNRAISRTSVEHFGHLIIVRGRGASRSEEAVASLFGRASLMLKSYREVGMGSGDTRAGYAQVVNTDQKDSESRQKRGTSEALGR